MCTYRRSQIVARLLRGVVEEKSLHFFRNRLGIKRGGRASKVDHWPPPSPPRRKGGGEQKRGKWGGSAGARP